MKHSSWLLICVAAAIFGCRGREDAAKPSPSTRTPEPVKTVVPQERYANVSNPYAGPLRARVTEPGEAVRPLFLHGKLATRALTCANRNCPGVRESGDRPFLFVGRYKNVRQGPDGEPIWPKPDSAVPTPCPACGLEDTVFPYVPLETQRRMEQLRAELTASRQARDEARKARIPPPPTIRTPAEIMDEMQNLPLVFIIQED